MKKKARKPMHAGSLHRGVIIPITDPAEQAALDRRFREAEKALAAGNSEVRKPKARKGK